MANVPIQIKRIATQAAAAASATVLLEGQIVYVQETRRIYVGDGLSALSALVTAGNFFVVSAGSDFASQVRATSLTGLSTATNSPVTSSETVLEGIGRLQAQMNRRTRNIFKASDTSRTNNTLLADPDLVLPMLADTTYSGIMTIFVSASAAGDFKSRVTGPASPTSVIISQAVLAPTGSTLANRTAAAYDSSDLVQTNTVDFVVRLQIQFCITNGANAGDLVFNWGQNSTSANATRVMAGSTIEWVES